MITDLQKAYYDALSQKLTTADKELVFNAVLANALKTTARLFVKASEVATKIEVVKCKKLHEADDLLVPMGKLVPVLRYLIEQGCRIDDKSKCVYSVTIPLGGKVTEATPVMLTLGENNANYLKVHLDNDTLGVRTDSPIQCYVMNESEEEAIPVKQVAVTETESPENTDETTEPTA